MTLAPLLLRSATRACCRTSCPRSIRRIRHCRSAAEPPCCHNDCQASDGTAQGYPERQGFGRYAALRAAYGVFHAIVIQIKSGLLLTGSEDFPEKLFCRLRMAKAFSMGLQVRRVPGQWQQLVARFREHFGDFGLVMKGRVVHDDQALRPERGQEHVLCPCRHRQMGAACPKQHRGDPGLAPLCHEEIGSLMVVAGDCTKDLVPRGAQPCGR